MKKKLDCEKLADHFSKEINSNLPQTSTISRCDLIIIKDDKILFIEKTKIGNKKIYLPNRFSDEVVENVKKMWGSLATFCWYSCCKEKNLESKERIFLIAFEEKLDNRHLRLVSNLIKAIRKFRNGAFSKVKYIEKRN
ncbi:hypothetical protein [Thermovibrio sp.]